METNWSSPSGTPDFPAPRSVLAAPMLRPLTTGELLDSTFTFYRSHFWLFASLAAISGAAQALVQVLQLGVRHELLVHAGPAIANGVNSIVAGVLSLLILPIFAIVHAATTFALAEFYLERPITANESLRATTGRWLRYVGIAFWQGWSALWLFLLIFIPVFVLIFRVAARGGAGSVSTVALIGFGSIAAILIGGVYGAIAYIRNSLAIPATVVEGLGVRASMRRSKALAVGTKGRIFLLLLIFYALYVIVSAIAAPLTILIVRDPFGEHLLAHTAVLIIGFFAHTLLSPIVAIGLALVYFDQRVRKEAFDLQVLLGTDMSGVPAIAPAPIAAPAPLATETPLAAEAPLDPADPFGDDGRI